MTGARRATPNPGDFGVQVAAGDLSARDIGRTIELDYKGPSGFEVHIAGQLRALNAHTEMLTVYVDDPAWTSFEPIDVDLDHPVTLGEHPEASRR